MNCLCARSTKFSDIAARFSLDSVSSMRHLGLIVAILFIMVPSRGNAIESECMKNPQKFIEMTDDLIAKAVCSADPNFSTCAKIKGFASHQYIARQFAIAAANVDVPEPVSFLHSQVTSHVNSQAQSMARKAVDTAAVRVVARAPVAELEDQALRGILRNTLFTQGAKTLAYSILSATVFNVAGFAANYSETGCSTLIDMYVDHEPGGCKPFEGFSPRFLNFLQLPPEKQMEIVSSTPGLCEMVKRTWEKQRKPVFKNAVCQSGGGVAAERGGNRIEFRAEGRQLKSFHDSSLGSILPYKFGYVRYGDHGQADAVCLNKVSNPAPSECDDPMKIDDYDQNGKAKFVNYQLDTVPIVESSQHALDSARSHYCDLAEALACCSPNDGPTPTAERCRTFGITLSNTNNVKTQSTGGNR